MQSVTNKSPGDRVLPDGTLIPAGQTVDTDLAAHKGHPVVDAWIESGELKVAGATAKKAEAKADTKPAAPAYVTKHRGGGSYSVMEGDKEVIEGLSKADAETFNAFSDQDKAKFVASNKA